MADKGWINRGAFTYTGRDLQKSWLNSLGLATAINLSLTWALKRY